MGKGHILVDLKRIEDIEKNGGGGSGAPANVKDVTVPLLVDSWEFDETSNTYSQVAIVDGLTEDANPIILLNSENELASEDEINAYTCITESLIEKGKITFIANVKPSISISLIVKSVVGSGSSGGADITELENRVEALEADLKDVVIPLLLTDWVEEGDNFVQNITVDGLSGDIVPIIALSSVGENATEDENHSYACISDVVVTEGNIKFIASEKPSISFTVVAKGVSANVDNVVADVTALVGRVSELEGEVEQINSDIAPKKEWCIGLTLNGEKIYQTIVNLNPEIKDSGSLVTVEIDHGIENIKCIQSVQIGFVRPTDGLYWSLPYMHLTTQEIYTWLDSVTPTNIKLRNKANWESCQLQMIISYTKK